MKKKEKKKRSCKYCGKKCIVTCVKQSKHKMYVEGIIMMHPLKTIQNSTTVAFNINTKV